MNEKAKQLAVEIEALERRLDESLSMPEADSYLRAIIKKKAELKKIEEE